MNDQYSRYDPLPHHPAVRDALTLLTAAMTDTSAGLPPAVQKAHSMANIHATAPWESVKYWLLGQEDKDPRTVDSVIDLALIAEAIACLNKILTRARGPIGSLKLAKTRHVDI